MHSDSIHLLLHPLHPNFLVFKAAEGHIPVYRTHFTGYKELSSDVKNLFLSVINTILTVLIQTSSVLDEGN